MADQQTPQVTKAGSEAPSTGAHLRRGTVRTSSLFGFISLALSSKAVLWFLVVCMRLWSSASERCLAPQAGPTSITLDPLVTRKCIPGSSAQVGDNWWRYTPTCISVEQSCVIFSWCCTGPVSLCKCCWTLQLPDGHEAIGPALWTRFWRIGFASRIWLCQWVTPSSLLRALKTVVFALLLIASGVNIS